MEIVAHGLWAVAAARGKGTVAGAEIPAWRTACWAMFPDVLAFGPMVAAGLWALATGKHGGHIHVNFGLPLYAMGHSMVVFAVVFGLAALAMRRLPVSMLGWLLHIVIDIFTHSYRFYATRFLWPLSDFRVDGIAWRTPWFWAATYIALALVYLVLWKTGRLGRRRNENRLPMRAGR